MTGAAHGAGAGRRGPPPNAVRYNEWRSAPVPAAGTFAPTDPVSVVVPCYGTPRTLACTLAALERQSYPRELFEVVVVDDGTEPPLEAPASALAVRVVRQPRRGFGLARARNTGVRAAAHDIVVFLDADMLAEAELIAAHARWHHGVADALTLGLRAYADAAHVEPEVVRAHRGALGGLFGGAAADPPWNERHLARTAELTARREDLFRMAEGANFAVRRAFYWEVGGFDESFGRYGGEDTEFAYRAQVRGALLVPVREAFAWHQGRWSAHRGAKDDSARAQAGKLANLIAEPGFRPASPGRIHAVPRCVATVCAGGDEPAQRTVAAVEDLLADPAGDLVVRIEAAPDTPRADVEWLRDRFGPDPRVRVAPARSALDAFAASPLHAVLPAAARAGALLRSLEADLGDAVVATADLGGGRRAWIARAWALHRARRTGRAPAAFGDVRRGRCRRAGIGRRRARGPGAGAARVLAEARHVRGLRTGWRFVAWLAGAARWRLHLAVSARPRAGELRPTGVPLGAEIAALGPRAEAVFAASGRVRRPGEGHVDVVLADAAAAAPGAGAPVVDLAGAPALAVPAFDPRRHNPIGWVRNVEPVAAALGPRRLLPAGAPRRVAECADGEGLRRCHHLRDVAAYHPGPVERAGTLARLAARGVPVYLADGGPGLEDLLGAELHALMTADVAGADAPAREAASIRMRRAALRGHSLRARCRQVCAGVLDDPPRPPAVSILLATRRPRFLGWALANVARQNYPALELVLALHGGGFGDGAEARAAALGLASTTLRLDARAPFGSVLNAAAAAAGGTLVAKMDDDDLYGADHIWDLVLAREYAGAELVGKSMETVYLGGRDRTVRHASDRTESYHGDVAGGTLLIARDDLERAGGWRRAARGVDGALVADVGAAGGTVYRTHGAGYVLVRHGAGHAWQADEADFLARADVVRAGWRPALAGFDASVGRPPLTGCGG